MKRLLFGARWVFVTMGIVLLTSLTVDATIGGKGFSQSALGILALTVSEKVEAGCPLGTERLGGEFARVCVDIFEVSPGATCPAREVTQANDTRANSAVHSCLPVSEKDRMPWAFITMNQAQELCARAGKRLLTHAEWYRASLGTPDGGETTCNISSNAQRTTGAEGACVSGVGAYDMVGNVWEWVDGQVENNMYGTRALPVSGYVAEADQDGVVTKTAESPQVDYHDDYFWTTEQGIYGMLRGGFYGGAADAGIYSIQAKTPLSFVGSGVGFRCALDLSS